MSSAPVQLANPISEYDHNHNHEHNTSDNHTTNTNTIPVPYTITMPGSMTSSHTAHSPSAMELNDPQADLEDIRATTNGQAEMDNREHEHEHMHDIKEKRQDAPAAASGPGGPAGPGGPGGRPQLEKYSNGFFSPQMTGMRKVAFKILVPAMVLTILMMWLCLPVYWGSLWKSNVYTDKLTVRVIDRDGGQVGSTISNFLYAQSNLHYFPSPASDWIDNDVIATSVVNEHSWAAIVIESQATTNLQTARQNGIAAYNGTSAISVYYSQARNELAVNSYLVPLMQGHMGAILGRLNAQSISSYITANSGNTTAINLLGQAPSTLNNGIYYTLFNLRPYNQPVAQAITLVGLIYMLIFSFIVTMVGSTVRDIISPYMTTRSLIGFRLITPLIAYIPLALFFSMISLPFKANFGAHYTYAGGFFLWAFTIWLGMCSVGLSLEFAITILTQRFIAFFMIALIIANVSVAALPHELMPWIFGYQAAMPFYNVGRIVRTIIFNTRNQVGENIGILVAWVVVNMITISIATWFMRRKDVNAHRRAKAEEGKVVA